MQRVLVIRLSSLGDILQTFPALQNLGAQPDIEVHVLTKEAYKSLLEQNPSVTRVHTISNHARLSELIHVVSHLKRLQFSQVYDLHNNLRSWITGFFLQVPTHRIRKPRVKEILLYLFHAKFLKLFGFKSINRVQEALRVVGGGGESKSGSSDFYKPFNPLPQEIEDGIERFNADGFTAGFVCICVESAWAQKKWDFEKFFKLAQDYFPRKKLGVIWIGLEPVPSTTHMPGMLDLTSKLELPQLAGLLKRAKLMVSNDSGLMHLAESVGTKVLSVFGPTSRELGFAPRLPQSRILELDLWCRPCSKTGQWCFRFNKRWKCLRDLTVEHAVERLNEP